MGRIKPLGVGLHSTIIDQEKSWRWKPYTWWKPWTWFRREKIFIIKDMQFFGVSLVRDPIDPTCRFVVPPKPVGYIKETIDLTPKE
jgi:hypothetical protein